jgi:DNA-binding response OmpR family regulator
MEGYQAVSFNSIGGEGIIPILDGEKPHILILDFHLGTKETIEHIITIRADNDWQNLPIIMASAIDRRQNCMKVGADDFILKPFNWQDLTQRINQIRDDLI